MSLTEARKKCAEDIARIRHARSHGELIANQLLGDVAEEQGINTRSYKGVTASWYSGPVHIALAGWEKSLQDIQDLLELSPRTIARSEESTGRVEALLAQMREQHNALAAEVHRIVETCELEAVNQRCIANNAAVRNADLLARLEELAGDDEDEEEAQWRDYPEDDEYEDPLDTVECYGGPIKTVTEKLVAETLDGIARANNDEE